MSQIFEKLNRVDPNDSDAVKETLATFFHSLSKTTELDNTRWLNAIENVLRRFPKYCSTHRNTIDNYLIKFLDSANYYTVINAAKCAHILQQVRPSQDKEATSKACWRELVRVLCQAANDIIEVLFSKAVNIYKTNNKLENKETKVLAGTPLVEALVNITKFSNNTNKRENKTSIFSNRLKNVFVFLQAMLVEIYPVAKPVQPQLILQVILQSLSLSSATNTDVDVSAVKIEALRVLDALIACLGSNLIPFSALVFRFAMQTLRWSFETQNENSGKVRCAAYKSLARWLNVLHVHKVSHETRGKLWEDEITGFILEDIIPPKKIVQLTMNAQPTKNLSKKARKKMAKTMLQESSIASHMPGEKNKIVISEEISDEVAIAALKCGETFLAVCGIFLKPSTHKILQEHLVKECYNINSYSSDRGLHLLRTLEAARKCVPSTIPPPTQYCLQLYSYLLHATNSEIVKFCSHALLDIRLHLHCSPPSLNFALEARPEDDRKNKKDKRKRISEKNRAVLESLLGKDRMPSNDDEDVINVTDEPVTKKIRVDNETEQISVSSASEKSIEISDDSDVENTGQEEIVIEEVKEGEQENVISLEPVVEEPDIQENRQSFKKTNEKDGDINNANTQIIINLDDNSTTNDASSENKNIYDAKTQMPHNTSTDTMEDEEEPLSMEVGYDYSNAGKEITPTVTIIEKMEEDNIQSSTETDDIQITCGQQVKISQDDDKNENSDQDIGKEVKNNEVNTDKDMPIENGIDKPEIIQNVNIQITTNGGESAEMLNQKEISVQDMLADFVDEVNEENKSEPCAV